MRSFHPTRSANQNLFEKLMRLQIKLSLGCSSGEIKRSFDPKKHFYRLLAKRGKTNVFLKTLLSKNLTYARELENEINFHLALKKYPNLELNRYVPPILEFSLAPPLPYLLRVSAPGVHRKSEDNFTDPEIKTIAKALNAIRNTDSGIFRPVFDKDLFSARYFALQVKKHGILASKMKERLLAYTQQNKGLFSRFKPVLSHGDFSEANVVFWDGARMSVIDWTKTGIRNPLYDLAEFWIKRRRRPREQEILLITTDTELSKKDFNLLFDQARVEIILRDLNLFNVMAKNYDREKKGARAKRVAEERLEYLTILKNILFYENRNSIRQPR